MPRHKFLAIDQGTTSSRAIIFSDRGEILATSQKELRLYYPHNGWGRTRCTRHLE
jgi:glycerol kinase